MVCMHIYTHTIIVYKREQVNYTLMESWQVQVHSFISFIAVHGFSITGSRDGRGLQVQIGIRCREKMQRTRSYLGGLQTTKYML